MKNRLDLIAKDDYFNKAYISLYVFDTNKFPLYYRTKYGLLYLANKTLVIFRQFEKLKGPTLHKNLSPKAICSLISINYKYSGYGCFLTRFPQSETSMLETINEIFDDWPEKNELIRILNWMKENE